MKVEQMLIEAIKTLEPCSQCDGSGIDPCDEVGDCDNCGGAGVIATFETVYALLRAREEIRRLVSKQNL